MFKLPFQTSLKKVAAICALSTPFLTNTAIAQTKTVEIIEDDGAFAGSSLGTTHQNNAEYQIEKTLSVPAEALQNAKQARVRVYMTLRDNSRAGGGTANGMDEAFEVVVNGKPFVYQTDDPTLPSVGASAPRWQWHDFTIPVSDLKPGANTFLFRKTPSPKNDDFLYIGIDASQSRGHSRATLDGGKTWSRESLNAIRATGEYMIRLILLDEAPQAQTTWTPQQTIDPQKLIGYSERDGNTQTFELDSFRFDALQPFAATIEYQGAAPQVRWLDADNQPIAAQESTPAPGTLHAVLSPRKEGAARLEISDANGSAPDVRQVRFEFSPPVGSGRMQRIDMAPRVLPAAGKPVNRAPAVLRDADGFTLHNSTLAARFETKPNLRLVTLRNEYLQKNVLAHPTATKLFLIEVGDKRYGASDWQVREVKTISPTQIAVQLVLPEPGLEAQFTIGVNEQNLLFGLKITNAGRSTQSWKTAFPHLGGIQLSASEAGDYYLFPTGGGTIADVNANLKSYYGSGSAWWQMVDVFSPSGGAGLSLRNLDETGLFKGIALRKGLAPADGASRISDLRAAGSGGLMAEDMGWQNTLEAAPGVSAAFEYVKYTREPGGSFSPPEVALRMHEGDWQTAMREYSDWAHRVWKWRPASSKLRDVWNLQASGWGQNHVFKDGKWRTYDNKKFDAIELMSWWQWSQVGPWQVPIDRLVEEFGQAYYDSRRPFWVINPATGKLEYPLNRGDYDYNASWGGLPALRGVIKQMKEAGVVSMFYTDPILADANTRLAQEYGRKYGVMNPLWKPSDSEAKFIPSGYVGNYSSYNMCMDNQWYQDFVVDLTARLVRDTGVEGIRFDEFGHRGYVCHNPQHKHLFAEPGHNAWMQAVTETTRRVQEEAKKIDPDFILTTEYSGYDRLAATLEGALNYESARSVYPGLRPTPLNVFRFYFPSHKQFDLDTDGSPEGVEWRFWNATGASFSNFLHPPRYHRILKENSDAFGSRDVTPLVSGPAQGIYANRFEGGGKTIHLLYNARGFTVNEPVLSAPAKAGFHYFDLVNGTEIQPQNGAIVLKLSANKTAAIARLPQVLSTAKAGSGWRVKLARAVPEAKVLVCDAEGKTLSTHDAAGTDVVFSARAKTKPAFVKLLSGKYLLDAAQLP